MGIEYTPKQKGIITEERCKLYFLEHGWTVSVPIGDNARYDFILDIGNKLLRLQCKTSSEVRHGLFYFECSMSVSSRTKLRSIRYTPEEIDAFCTYFQEKVYIVPFEDVGTITLRTEYPNHNTGGNPIRWAYEYEADYVVGQLLNDPEYPKRDVQEEFEKYVANREKEENKHRKFSWITNGERNSRIPFGSEIPEGFVLGRVLRPR